MTDLSTEQSAALVAALENGGRFPSETTGGLWCSLIDHHGDFETGFYCELSQVGRIVAHLCKGLAEVQKNLTAETVKLKWKDLGVKKLSKKLAELSQRQPYWRPIAECGEPEDGTYVGLWGWNGSIDKVIRLDGEWFSPMPTSPTHILYLGPSPVTVPAQLDTGEQKRDTSEADRDDWIATASIEDLARYDACGYVHRENKLCVKCGKPAHHVAGSYFPAAPESDGT